MVRFLIISFYLQIATSISFADETSCILNRSAELQSISVLSHAIPNDEEIFSVQDLNYCKPAPHLSKAVDPHSLPDNGTVWRVGSKRWTDADEKAYGDFITKEVDPKFFERYQIPTDCADAAITVRLIFARIHHLPFTIQNESGVFGFNSRKFSRLKTIKDWDESNWKASLKTDLRFRAFVDQVQNKISTANVDQNTYPIHISECKKPGSKRTLSKWVLPGTLLLDSDHTRFISKIDSTDKVEPVQEMSSTVPKDIRELHTGPAEVEYGGTEKYGRGVLRFNWAVNCSGSFKQIADEKMPGFSREQYSLKGKKDAAQYLTAVAPGKRGPADRAFIDKKVAEMKVRLLERSKVINEAIEKLKHDPKALLNDAVYDNYSTPSLDNTLYEKLEALHDGEDTWPDEVNAYANNKLDRMIISLGNGKFMTYRDFFFAQMQKRVSTDPNDPLLKRWGWDYMTSELDRSLSERDYLKSQFDQTIQKLNSVDFLKYKLGYLKIPEESNFQYYDQRVQELLKKGVRFPSANVKQ